MVKGRLARRHSVIAKLFIFSNDAGLGGEIAFLAQIYV
jgi:hypothetical protein